MTTQTRTVDTTSNKAGRRWLLFFHLPVLAIALLLTAALMVNGRRLDASLLDNQRIAATAARMGTLAEETEKSLLLVERSVRDNQPANAPLYELQRSADRLDQIISCFNDGGETVAPDNSRIMIDPIADERAAASLQEMNTIWFGIKAQTDKPIRLVSQKKELTVAGMREASEFVHAQAGRFAEQSLTFSKRLEVVQKDAAAERQWLQGLGNVLAVLAWSAMPVVFLLTRTRRALNVARHTAEELGRKQGMLEQKTTELSAAKHETDRIMETVQEGLLLMDKTYIIGAQHSAQLRDIMRMDNPAGMSLLNQLQRLLTEKMYNTTKDYFELLFDGRRKEKTVLKVNPLDQVEVHFNNPTGGFATRHLGFSFRRIMSGEQVERVFVAIKDITAQVELERSLREAEKHKDRQLEILLNIINVDPASVSDFSALATRELALVNDSLKAEDFAAVKSGQSQTLRPRLQKVFASVHNIKGNAAVLGLDYFAGACKEFETNIAELLAKPSLGGDDFLSIVVHQSRLKSDLSELHELQEKIGKLRALAPQSKQAAQPTAAAVADRNAQAPGKQTQNATIPTTAPSQPGSEAMNKLATQLQGFASKAAQELGKEVSLEIDTAALAHFGDTHHELLRDVLIQLTRNALAHSIEAPAERTRLGKPASGVIRVSAMPRDEAGQSGLLFRDDGQGLNLPKIRARAVEQGLVPAEQAAALAEDEVAALIFEPGLSTAENTGDHAGRGMGMDIIKARIVDEAGGDLFLQSEPGKFCEFGFILPSAA